MSRWPEAQGAFVAALRDAHAPPPDQIGKTAGAPSARRFSVYRNNVTVSLIDALAANFPVVAALIGEQPFAGLARSYMAAHLPKTPLLMEYGDQFPDFIKSFKPLTKLDFLADVARLEWAWNTAYNAADVKLTGIKALSALPPERLGEVTITLHPAVGLVCSAHPIASIWFAHQGCDTRTVLGSLPKTGEDALVTRPGADVEIRRLPDGAAVFIGQLIAGRALGDATETAIDACETFDPSTAIGGLFESGAVHDLKGPV